MTPDELNEITRSIHDDLIEATEPLARAYKKVLRGAGRKMSRKFRAQATSLVAAVRPEAFVPPDGDEVVPDVSAQIQRATGQARKDLLARLHESYVAHEIPLDQRRPLVSPELLDKVGERASIAVTEDLRDTYRGVIQMAAEHGFSIPRTAGAIVTEFDGISDSRATALARTDLIGLMNGATQTAATRAFSGRDDVTKVWLATEDERTRETHADADGQEVPLNDFFTVGDDSLMYPGDPDGSDEEVINCRCTLVYSGSAGSEGGVVPAGDAGDLPERTASQLADDRSRWRTVGPQGGEDGLYHVYHGTTADRAEAIKANGLAPPGDLNLTLTTSPGQAARYAQGYEGDPVVVHFALTPGDAQVYLRPPEEHNVYGFKANGQAIRSGKTLPSRLLAPSPVTASAVLPDTYASGMDDNEVTAAVTITVEDENAESTGGDRQRTPWEGILAIAGSPTSDGRYLIPGEIGQRDLPLPVAGSHEKQRDTETAGRIEVIEHIPLADFDKPGWELPGDLPPQAVVIWGEGSFSANDEGDKALEQLENGVGVSLDLPMERQAIIDSQTYEEVDPSTLDEGDLLTILFGGAPEGYLRGIAGKIGGLSLASIAAFEETTIRIVDSTAIVASGYAIREREDPFLAEITEHMIAAIDGPAVGVQAPLMPPREFFFREEADEPTPITILPSGEFYGHLALWNTCHAGRANGAYSACMYAPHSRTAYELYHLGSMLCDDGTEVPVGRITIGTGHAPLNLSAAAARRHYDHTGTCVAAARAKDGVFGIWLSGVIKSDATPEQVRDFRLCPPSGDWRAHEGRLELQAALAVNTPAFPVARSQLALSASAESLEIATLILGPPDADDFAEALRAEYDLQLAEDIDMLVELGVGEFTGVELANLGTVDFRDYSAEERRRMARSGEAMPDGSFPIANCTDARNAIQSQGRGGASQQRITSHIRKRVGSLGCSGSIFDPYK